MKNYSGTQLLNFNIGLIVQCYTCENTFYKKYAPQPPPPHLNIKLRDKNKKNQVDSIRVILSRKYGRVMHYNW